MVRVIYVDVSEYTEADYSCLYDKASPARRRKADSYRNRQDSLRCVCADALLRYALGTDRFEIEYMLNGKPYLPERRDFCFNISHSGKWVVLAYGDAEVGVDVEAARKNLKIDPVSGRFFTPEEQRYVMGDSSRFLEVWTAKESYIKYLGTGLQKALNSFNVFNLADEVTFRHRWLEDGACLCLCAKDKDTDFGCLRLIDLL